MGDGCGRHTQMCRFRFLQLERSAAFEHSIDPVRKCDDQPS
jgi:hypothetical protein